VRLASFHFVRYVEDDAPLASARRNHHPMKDEPGMLKTQKFLSYFEDLQRRERVEADADGRARLQAQLALAERAAFIPFDGVAHHYYEYGARGGVPVILLHGWDCSSYWFYRLAPILAENGFHVVAFDFRGHGFSESDPQERYSIPQFARDALALADAVGFAQFHLVSFSLGAAVALATAHLAPERVVGNVMMNFGDFEYDAFKERILPKLLDTIFRGLRWIKWWVPAYFYVWLTLCKRNVSILDVEIGISGLRSCDPRAALLAVTDIASEERVAQLRDASATLQSPTLVIVGDADPVIPFSESLRLAERIPQATMHILERTGHLVLFERADDINVLIADTLRGFATNGAVAR
jgi:pimeloyl-ACP methyl ester carboxylesterase